jgi:hypothetical protein
MTWPRAVRCTTTAVALLAVLLVGGCADEGENYCDALVEEQTTLTDLADSSVDGEDVLGPTLESFQTLQSEAPEELLDEWDTLVVAYQALVDAVDAAGIDPADYDPEKPPDDLSANDADRLAAVASKLRSTRVNQAAGGIQDHAREVCEVEFTG